MNLLSLLSTEARCVTISIPALAEDLHLEKQILPTHLHLRHLWVVEEGCLLPMTCAEMPWLQLCWV